MKTDTSCGGGPFAPDASSHAPTAPQETGLAPRATGVCPSTGRVRSLGEARDDSVAILGFLRAGMACGAVDPDRSLWVIDLAPSDGERAWRVLHLLHEAAPRGPVIRYLACCRDPGHRAALAAHPPLRPLLEDGRLRLDVDGEWLRLSAPRNPLAVLAYGAFSSAEQGLYRLGGGASGDMLGRSLEQAVRETGDGPRQWRAVDRRDGPLRLLAAYADTPRPVVASLPLGAMRTLEALLRLGEGRMLVRAVDRGLDDAQTIRAGDDPDAPRAGVRTPRRAGRLPVNFDALARWHRANGSGAVHSQRSERGRVLHLAVHDRDGGRLQACLPALTELPHPDDHIALLEAIAGLRGLAPAQCLSLLQATHADPRAVEALSIVSDGPLRPTAGVPSPRLRRLLMRSERLRYPALGAAEAPHTLAPAAAQPADGSELAPDRPPVG